MSLQCGRSIHSLHIRAMGTLQMKNKNKPVSHPLRLGTTFWSTSVLGLGCVMRVPEILEAGGLQDQSVKLRMARITVAGKTPTGVCSTYTLAPHALELRFGTRRQGGIHALDWQFGLRVLWLRLLLG